MKRTLTIVMLSVLIVSFGLPARVAQAGDKEWATTGKILTGVIAAGVIANACAPPPPRRAVVYYRPPIVRPYAVVAPRYVRYVPPYRYYGPYCPPVRYVAAPVVVAPAVPAVETVWIVNSNGSRTPVELRRAEGGLYVGPKGEYYTGLPDNEQLRQLYGM
jgi:hypothetical protein